MSGHSKWSTIKRAKGVADAKRGQVFTKIANNITIAVREGGGGDPTSNFKLRLGMDQAKAANMPKENIQRAIDRGLGKGAQGTQLESVSYEGYGPGKVAVIVEATTDNRNRTGAEIKGAIERNGGTFAAQGAVSWMFSDEGVITIEKRGKSFDEIFEAGVESGAEDVEDAGETVQVYTKPNELDSVKKSLEVKKIDVSSAELSKKASSIVEIKDKSEADKVIAFMEKLEDLDDVSKVYSNFDIAEGLL